MGCCTSLQTTCPKGSPDSTRTSKWAFYGTKSPLRALFVRQVISVSQNPPIRPSLLQFSFSRPNFRIGISSRRKRLEHSLRDSLRHVEASGAFGLCRHEWAVPIAHVGIAPDTAHKNLSPSRIPLRTHNKRHNLPLVYFLLRRIVFWAFLSSVAAVQSSQIPTFQK